MHQIASGLILLSTDAKINDYLGKRKGSKLMKKISTEIGILNSLQQKNFCRGKQGINKFFKIVF
jgi:hypothetical protein